MERLPEELNNQIFRKLKSIVEVERMTLDERLEYELSLSLERDLYACMATQFEEGEAKGLLKGKEEGKAEGKAEGLAEGEAKGLRLVAENLKKRRIDLATIMSVTGLDEETINKL